MAVIVSHYGSSSQIVILMILRPSIRKAVAR